MTFSSSILVYLLVLLLTNHRHISSLSFNNISSHLSLLLPLKTQTSSANSSLPPPIPNTTKPLIFHHNITLTVALSVGTPPRNVSMVLDTGSELSWLLCNANSTFHPINSSTFRPVPCQSSTCTSLARDLSMPPTCDEKSQLCRVSLSYADASSSDGALSVDAFSFGTSLSLPTVFGCMDSSYSSTNEDPLASGLLGMNRGALSFITQSNITRFSYCISDLDSSGILVIGDAADSEAPPLNYTPMIDISLPLPYFDRVAYSVQLEGIRVSGKLLPIPKSVLVPDHTGAGQTMVDSGTQFTFLLGPAYDALKTEFVRQIRGVVKSLDEPDFVFQGALDLCFLIPAWMESPPAGIPSVALVFRGAEVEVMGDRLLYRVESEHRGGDVVWCFTFGNSDLVPLSAYVIGHHHQHNVWVEYDIKNGRVGFAPTRCDLAGQRLGITP